MIGRFCCGSYFCTAVIFYLYWPSSIIYLCVYLKDVSNVDKQRHMFTHLVLVLVQDEGVSCNCIWFT